MNKNVQTHQEISVVKNCVLRAFKSAYVQNFVRLCPELSPVFMHVSDAQRF